MITSSKALQSVLEEVIARLKEFAADPGFRQKMGRVFGAQAPSAEHLLALVAKPPAIQVVPATELQGALGAYSLRTGEILLSRSLVEGEAGALRSVLLEELGHALDAAVNGQDTRGDEGEGFAAIVEGRELRPLHFRPRLGAACFYGAQGVFLVVVVPLHEGVVEPLRALLPPSGIQARTGHMLLLAA